MNASVRFRTDPPGVVEVPARDHPVVVIHVGPSVYIHCRRGPWSHCGLGVHGDIDIVPAGVPARWEMKERDNVVLLDVANPGAEIRNRFQIRDRKLEVLGQAMWRGAVRRLSQWPRLSRHARPIGSRTPAGSSLLLLPSPTGERRPAAIETGARLHRGQFVPGPEA